MFLLVKFDHHYFNCYSFLFRMIFKVEFLFDFIIFIFFIQIIILIIFIVLLFRQKVFINVFFFRFQTSTLNLLGIKLLDRVQIGFHELWIWDINPGLEDLLEFTCFLFFFCLSLSYFSFISEHFFDRRLNSII
jgi:hypothetical protein